MKTGSHQELIVWQKAMNLVVEVYTLTGEFPRDELYGITSQIRRAAVSIPSNIAEGRRRGTVKEYRRFLLVAYGSAAELETQLELSFRLRFVTRSQGKQASDLLSEVLRMLNTMSR